MGYTQGSQVVGAFNVGLWQCNKSVTDPTLFYIRHGGSKLTDRRLTTRSTKTYNHSYYEGFNPKDFASFGGTEFDIISRVTLSKEDQEKLIGSNAYWKGQNQGKCLNMNAMSNSLKTNQK